jgi:rRNA maturation endonuclease Nob1
VRSFDAKEPTEVCKFCGGAARSITGAKYERPLAQKYHYYCANCEKNFESFTTFENCPICSGKIAHIYTWKELSAWEKISVHLKKMTASDRKMKINNGKRKFSLFGKQQEELPTR